MALDKEKFLDQYTDFMAKVGELDDQLTAAKEEIGRLRRIVDKDDVERLEHKEEIERLNQQLHDLNDQHNAILNDRGSVMIERDRLTDQLTAAKEEIERLKAELVNARNSEITWLEKYQKELTAEREAKEKLKEAADMPYVEMGDHIWISNDDWANLQQALKELEAK